MPTFFMLCCRCRRDRFIVQPLPEQRWRLPPAHATASGVTMWWPAAGSANEDNHEGRTAVCYDSSKRPRMQDVVPGGYGIGPAGMAEVRGAAPISSPAWYRFFLFD